MSVVRLPKISMQPASGSVAAGDQVHEHFRCGAIEPEQRYGLTWKQV
jgi:hypothetical protein